MLVSVLDQCSQLGFDVETGGDQRVVLPWALMSIDGIGLKVKSSQNLSYDEYKRHHRVRRPLISKYS